MGSMGSIDDSADRDIRTTRSATDIGLDPNNGEPSSGRSRWALPLAAAAALCALLVGLAVVVNGPLRENSGDVATASDTDAPPFPTPRPTGAPAACPASVEEFVDAVDAWDGVDQWADLIDERRPDPDLADLGAQALLVWRVLAPDEVWHEDLAIPVFEPDDDPTLLATEVSVRRAAPVKALFDAMATSSAQPESVLQPCNTQITSVVAEIGTASDTTVVVEIFSGLPNPSFRLSVEESADLAAAVAELDQPVAGLDSPTALGFRGFEVVGLSLGQDSASLIATGDTVEVTTGSSVVRLADDQQSVYLLLLELIRDRDPSLAALIDESG